jgi:hypothetical protein
MKSRIIRGSSLLLRGIGAEQNAHVAWHTPGERATPVQLVLADVSFTQKAKPS